MEHREDGLLVDYSGTTLKDSGLRQSGHAIVYNEKQEKELQTLDQETRLMRAMNEIRACSPKSMNTVQREMFAVMCEKILAKHGVNASNYKELYGHLGTADQLHR